MKRNHKLIIGVSSLEQSLKETLDACKKAKRGQPIGPVHRIDFIDQATLFSTLSPKRMELLRYLRKHGPMSARQIAKNLARDYKNIQVDIKLLSRLDMITTNVEGRYIVPWDDISIEVEVLAA